VLVNLILTIHRQYIQEIKGQDEAEKAASGGIGQGEKISRSTLEDDARESTLRGHGTPAERFWQRQRGQAETIAMGRQYISKVCLSFGRSIIQDVNFNRLLRMRPRRINNLSMNL